MDLDEFRRQGHRIVDWIADYLATVEDRPVRARTRPGEIAGRLDPVPPAEGVAMDRILADLDRDVMPGITHWQHPRFLAYFPANSSPPSVLAEMITAALGAQCMIWETSPAATEMETRMIDWLRQMIGLPEGFAGVIQDSASGATLCAILTARERATGWRVNEDGLGKAPPLAVYTSAEAHSATEKNVKIAGIGRANLRAIPVDENFAMCPDLLAQAVAADRAAGIRPTCVVATLGTTGVGAVDPLAPIGAICRDNDIFLHVDAAWAGTALVLDSQRWMLDGIAQVDSLVFNPHKWMLTNFDCSAHFMRDPDALVRTLSILPEYLKSREAGAVIDYRDWSVPLGRRFRALKLWFVIRSYGVEGIRAMIAKHIALAAELEGWIAEADDFELLAPRSLTLLNIRYRPPGCDDAARLDRLNETLLNRLNDAGKVYLTRNRVAGAFAIRVAVGQTGTLRRHVREAWDTIRDTARRLAVDA